MKIQHLYCTFPLDTCNINAEPLGVLLMSKYLENITICFEIDLLLALSVFKYYLYFYNFVSGKCKTFQTKN